MTLLDLPRPELLDTPTTDPRFDLLAALLRSTGPAPTIGDDPADQVDRDDDSDDEASPGSSFARCADGNGTLTHLFFSDDEFDIARAKAICSKCGLADDCLRDALSRAEAYGVWGGELVIDGVIVKVKRGRGRPPKTPRPPLVVDEVPLPPHLVA